MTLEYIIRQYVRMPQSVNSRGWHPVLCKVCNDHGRKGDRAAFLFSGDVCSYNCFNCAIKAVYDPSTSHSMSDKMITILRAFGIPDDEWKQVIPEFRQPQSSTFIPKKLKIEPDVIELPPSFYRVTDDNNDEWCQYVIEYLAVQRSMDWSKYPFYLSHKSNKRWYGRLIVPYYKDDKLVFYQGRDLTDIHKLRYLSPSCEKAKVMYGFDQLFKHDDSPIYVVEGFFDAFPLNGVAIFENKMSPEQVQWLTMSPRKKIVIPDKQGDGHLLAKQAISLGWGVSFPDMGSDSKDVCDGIRKYGELYMLNTIRDNTKYGFEAHVESELYFTRRDTH